MTWARNVDHVQIKSLDHSIQVNVNEVLAGRGSPVSQQPRLDMLELQGLTEEWVIIEIDLAHGEVIGGSPVGVHGFQEVGRERRIHAVLQKSSGILGLDETSASPG